MARIRLSLCLSVALIVGCDQALAPPGGPPAVSLDAELRATIGGWGVVPIGAMPPQNPAQVALGRALFFDRILSGNRDVSCASCHDVSAGLADARSLAIGTGGTRIGTARSLGVGRQFTIRSAPTLLNAGLGLSSMFWDARLSGGNGSFSGDSGLNLPPGLPTIIAAQALMPVLNRREMRGNHGDRDVFGNPNELALFADQQPEQVWSALVDRLLAIQEYVAMFNAAFPGATSTRFEHAARALAAFQMEAFTKTSSPFDRFLGRDDHAMTTEQKRGGLLFFGKARCSTCHNGPFLGGQSFANVGVPQVTGGGTREPPRDLGVGERQPEDFYRFAFRAAPLRNVELTAPYFHSGAYQTLEAVVTHYNNVPVALQSYDPSQLADDVRALYRGDPATVTAVLATLDGRLRQSLHLTPTEIGELVAFLKSLTDPGARSLDALVPARVPSGLPVRD